MKTLTSPASFPYASTPKHLLAILLLTVCAARCIAADTVYVTARGLHGPGPNDNGTYNDNGFGNDSTAASTAPGVPPRNGSRYCSQDFTNSTPDLGITLTPTLGLPGAVYQVDYTFSSTADNISSNILLSATNVAACTLSFKTNIDKFQSQYGQPAPQSWQFLGYLTNAPGSATPTITFYYQSGHISAGDDQRLNIDCFRFTSLDPCLNVPVPTVTGPISAGLTNVTVTGVSADATNVAVYQNTGTNSVRIGLLVISNPPTTVSVTVTGLVKGAQESATQKVKGQESCIQSAGTLVGGGANPSVRVALSIRGNTDLTGPVGSTGGGTNSNVYFLGASDVLPGACPDPGIILQPSTNWQSVTLKRGGDPGNPVDPVVLWNDGGGASPTLDGNFGALDGLAFACQGDNGPFDIYLDELENGTNGVLQDWEAGSPGAAYGFVAPRSSGTTSGNLLGAPDVSAVATNTAYSGKQCLRVRWQFSDSVTNLWLRLVTANADPVENPQVDLNEPISFRILLLPVGATPPPVPTPLLLSIKRLADKVVLDWSGSNQLQVATNVAGSYSDVTGVTIAPYTNTITGTTRFYRLLKK